MGKIPHLAEVIQTALIEEAAQAGRECGFIKCQRDLSGAAFVPTAA